MRAAITFRKEGYVDTTVVMSTSINPWPAALLLVQAGQFRNISPGLGIYGKLVIAVPLLFTQVADILLGGIFQKNDNPHVVRMKKTSAISTLTSVERNHSGH